VSSNKLDFLLKGDLVLDDRVALNHLVGVKDGVITGIYANDQAPSAEKSIDASGQLVFPGVVDAHVHSFSNLHEKFEHSTAAAAAGGVTTIIEMPYDQGAPVVTPEIFQAKIDCIRQSAKVDVALLATLPKNGDHLAINPLADMGACGFKLSVFETDPERFPRINDDVLLDLLPRIAETGLAVGFHAENDVIIEALISRFKSEGKTYPMAHCETRPPISETTAVVKLLEFAYWTGVKLHIYHVSHPRCLELVDWYRRQGVDVTAETCPHYLVLHEDDMDRHKAFCKINPPIRTKEARDAMWVALQNGLIDFIASDHAPWPLERKQNSNIFDNGSGSPGLEAILPLMYSEAVVKRGLDPVTLAQYLAQRPAERFKLAPRKGAIVVGADGDFAVLDPNRHWVFQAEKSRSSAKWSPYDGMEIQGKVTKSILRGRLIYEDDKLLAQGGDGEFIPAQR
jgi:allantoinase